MMHQISTVKLRVRGCYYSSERINSGEGGGVRNWLRHSSASRKVAGSIGIQP